MILLNEGKEARRIRRSCHRPDERYGRLMAETITHAGASWSITRLPSARDASRAANRIRPWLSRAEEEAQRQERLERTRRENGIPSPEEWMW